MLRRDFLLLRRSEMQTIAELSCEKLYMNFNDCNAVAAIAQPEQGRSPDAEWWSGEPPAVLLDVDARRMLDSIAKDILQADVMLVCDTQWLAGDELMSYFNRLVKSFTENGGRVEYRNHTIN